MTAEVILLQRLWWDRVETYLVVNVVTVTMYWMRWKNCAVIPNVVIIMVWKFWRDDCFSYDKKDRFCGCDYEEIDVKSSFDLLSAQNRCAMTLIVCIDCYRLDFMSFQSTRQSIDESVQLMKLHSKSVFELQKVIKEQITSKQKCSVGFAVLFVVVYFYVSLEVLWSSINKDFP